MFLSRRAIRRILNVVRAVLRACGRDDLRARRTARKALRAALGTIRMLTHIRLIWKVLELVDWLTDTLI